MSGFYQDEGGLPADAPSYVVRPADAQVLALCRTGGLGYVLAPRQTGKSSLVNRTRKLLAEESIPSVCVDLTAIGAADVTADAWYLSLLDEVRTQLGLTVDLVTWWRERAHLTVIKRLVEFLRTEVAERTSGPVALFLDEIESTRRLPFSADDFFAALRAIYNARATEPALRRLAIILLGVAAPSDLIVDSQRTPFNVGEPVELDDLSPEAARVLAAGLSAASDPAAVLARILYWTGGHPRLTQRLCAKVTVSGHPTPEAVDSVVHTTLLGAAGENDETLKEVRRQAERDPRAHSWLPLYRAVLHGRPPEVNWTDERQLRARLAGLVSGARGKQLRARNRIFAEVFGLDWVADRLQRDPMGWLNAARDQIFICSSSTKVDDTWRKRLRTHLHAVDQNARFIVWNEIPPGATRRDAVAGALSRARIAVLLVTPDLLADDFLAETQLPELLNAAKRNGVRILWIPVRPCDISATRFAQYHPIHDPAKPLSTLENPENAITMIGKSIIKAFREDDQGAAASSPMPLRDLVERLEVLLTQKLHTRPDHVRALNAEIDACENEIRRRGHVDVGSVVAGVRLRRHLGKGNFGSIWVGEREDGGGEVAVKVFHLQNLSQGMMLWRFRRSIRAMQRLASDYHMPQSIVRLHRASDDTLAFSMDFHPGGDLEDIAKRGWSLDKKIDVFTELCRAVQFAHRLGVVHRDLKPANVVLDAAGHPVLTDFDIADVKFVTRLSSTGGLGTPTFAAPEQLEDADKATEQSDIYSLGRLLHFLLLERSPGPQLEADPSLENIIGGTPPALVLIVRRATQFDPAKRYRSVTELLNELQRYRTGWAAIRARANNTQRWLRRNAALLTIFALVSGGLGAFGWWQNGVATREADLRKKLQEQIERINTLSNQVDEAQAKREQSLAEIKRLDNDIKALVEKIERTQGKAREGLLTEKATLEAKREAESKKEEKETERIQRLQQQLEEQRREAEAAKGSEAAPFKPDAGVQPVGARCEPKPLHCAKQEMTDGHGMTFVRVCAGTFCMGSVEDDQAADENERPAHAISLPEFWIGKYEVAKTLYHPPDGSVTEQDGLPATNVAWDDANRFCRALGHRLPTEAEWEYAARGTDGRRYPWGNEKPTIDRAVYGRGGGTKPEPVQSFPHGEGPFGTRHQAGNVWEWVADCYQDDIYRQHADKGVLRAPLVDNSKCRSRVLRGGAFVDGPKGLRSTFRLGGGSGGQSSDYGFRCARSSRPQP